MQDVPVLSALIERSVRELQRDDYSERQIELALRTVYGVDTTLIRDGTYFAVEELGEIVACGGWSKRKTLYGGDVWSGRQDELLDPRSMPPRFAPFSSVRTSCGAGLGRCCWRHARLRQARLVFRNSRWVRR